MTMGAIADTFELSSTAATGFVGRVERHGLVARQHRSDDRRVVECVLTEDGRHFVEEVVGVRLESVRQALGLLSPRQLSRFHKLVRRMIERREPHGMIALLRTYLSPYRATLAMVVGLLVIQALGDALPARAQRRDHQQRRGQGRHRRTSCRPAR